MRTDILGVGFDNLKLSEAVERGVAFLSQSDFHYVVTPNPEMVDRARQEAPFRAVLNQANLVLPDGIGIVHAGRILGTPFQARCPGIDFASGVMSKLALRGGRLFLLGAKPGVAVAAAQNLKQRYPNLRICGTHDGYFKDNDEVVREIKESAADLVFVCLGFPRQELWMAEHGPATGAKLMIGLGGALDVFAGVVQRAPVGWQKMGLEWAYRLFQEPSRFSRMVRLPLFLVTIVGEKMRRPKR